MASRAAVRGWGKAGLLDGPATAAALELYPLPGAVRGPVWRGLVFFFISAAILAFAGGTFALVEPRRAEGFGRLLLLLGAGCVAATETIVSRFRNLPTGAEAACSLWAVAFTGGGLVVLLGAARLPDPFSQRLGLAALAAVLLLAAWRWGFRIYAAAGVLAALWSLAHFPAPRLLSAVGAVVSAAAATWALSRLDAAPSHRGALEAGRLAALAVLYATVNYLSVDHLFFERQLGLGFRAAAGAAALPLPVAAAASALLPAALLGWGIRSRERVVLLSGAVFAAVSLATVRFYVHVAPLWAVLAAAGTTLAAGALLLERWLERGDGEERRGFSAARLQEGERRERLLHVAAGLAAAPGARSLGGDDAGPVGGGGGLGGGGASGDY